MPVMRCTTRTGLRRPRHVTAVRGLPDGRPARRARDVLSAPRPRLRCLPPRPAASVRPAREIFSEYAYFSSYSDTWVEHARRLRRRCRRALRPRRVERRGRGGQQRRLPAAPRRGPGHPGDPGDRARAQRRAGARRPRHPDDHRVLRTEELPARSWPRARAGRPRRRQQRVRARAGPRRLHRGLRTAPRAAWRHARSRSRTSSASSRATSSTRSTTSTSTYYTLLSAARGARPPRARVFDVDELPTHGGSLRVYARHDDDPTRDDRARRGPPGTGAAAGYAGARGLRGRSASGSRRRSATCSRSSRGTRGGRPIAAYGAPGKGNTLLNYCGIRSRPRRLHGRPQPVQARPVHARDAHPDPSRRAPRRDRPDVILVLPWNLRTEIVAPARHAPGVGRPHSSFRSPASRR